MSNKIKFQTNNSVYQNNKPYNSVAQNYRNSTVWSVYAKFDTNGNEKLEANEVEKFNSFIQTTAGNDGIIDSEELKKAAGSLGVSVGDLQKAASLLSSDVIADNLIENFAPRVFGSADKENGAKLIRKIDKNNVSEIWSQYQSLVDKRNSKFGILLKDTSLAKDILDNYSFSESAKLLKQIVEAMYSSAREQNIEIKTLVQDYNTALKNQDKKGMDAAIREMGARLNYAVRMDDRINEHLAKMGDNPKMNNKNLSKAKEIAAQYSASVTEDIVGNGKLGDTPSKAVTNEGKVILDALNVLLANTRTREKIQACMKKDKDCFNVYFPNANVCHSSTEYGLITENYIQNGVVGDGDMTLLVAAIMRRAELENVTLRNSNEAQKYIYELFNPELFGFTRLFKK